MCYIEQRPGPSEKLIERESMRSKCGAGDDFCVSHGQHANDFVLLEAGNPEPLESKATLAKL